MRYFTINTKSGAPLTFAKEQLDDRLKRLITTLQSKISAENLRHLHTWQAVFFGDYEIVGEEKCEAERVLVETLFNVDAENVPSFDEALQKYWEALSPGLKKLAKKYLEEANSPAVADATSPTPTVVPPPASAPILPTKDEMVVQIRAKLHEFGLDRGERNISDLFDRLLALLVSGPGSQLGVITHLWTLRENKSSLEDGVKREMVIFCKAQEKQMAADMARVKTETERAIAEVRTWSSKTFDEATKTHFRSGASALGTPSSVAAAPTRTPFVVPPPAAASHHVRGTLTLTSTPTPPSAPDTPLGGVAWRNTQTITRTYSSVASGLTPTPTPSVLLTSADDLRKTREDLEKKQQELATLERKLKERAEALAQQQTELEKQARSTVQQEEERLAIQRREISERERNVARREADVTGREGAVARREAAVAQREAEAVSMVRTDDAPPPYHAAERRTALFDDGAPSGFVPAQDVVHEQVLYPVEPSAGFEEHLKDNSTAPDQSVATPVPILPVGVVSGASVSFLSHPSARAAASSAMADAAGAAAAAATTKSIS